MLDRIHTLFIMSGDCFPYFIACLQSVQVDNKCTIWKSAEVTSSSFFFFFFPKSSSSHRYLLFGPKQQGRAQEQKLQSPVGQNIHWLQKAHDRSLRGLRMSLLPPCAFIVLCSFILLAVSVQGGEKNSLVLGAGNNSWVREGAAGIH